MIRNRKLVIFLGALMILAGLLWMVEPYYTWAQEQGHPCRIELDPEKPLFELENMNPGDTEEQSITVIKTGSAPAELFFAWEWVEGDPPLGEEGSLFEQIEMLIISEGVEVFRGSMGDWKFDSENPSKEDAINLTKALDIGVIEQGDEVALDFRLHLPGPETGNEFQGSFLKTRLIFFTICRGDDPPPPPPDRPRINIEKATNGVDADAPTGPFIPIGDPVIWTYEVTNTGNVPLRNIEVTDNIPGVNPEYVRGDTNNDGILQVWETWIYEAEGTAEEGQYANIGTVVGTPPRGPDVSDDDPSHYFGFSPDEPAINIEKLTNGVDADLPTGPEIRVGDTVTWTYIVTNPGNVQLSNIVVTDNIAGVDPEYVRGDVNNDGILQPGETWIYEAAGEAEEGQYANIGTVVGTPPEGSNVRDRDPSHYIGVEEPGEGIVDPEDPAVTPDPEEPEEVIVRPEDPKIAPPLPRTDGVSVGLLAAGLLFLMAGLSLRKSRAMR